MRRRTPRIELRLEPEVMRSIVESSGMDHATIAKKMGVDKRRVDGWVRTGVIEYSKVREMARCVKRSENMFLRRVPPDSEDVPDFRMMDNAPRKLDAADRPTVRRVRYMQSVAEEMMDARGIAAGPEIPAGITVAYSADEVARAERIRLAVAGRPDGPLGGQSRDIYGRLRSAIEGLNILVFQYPLRTRGVRGLSMTGSSPRAILVNSKEIGEAKAFTLLHEYGHILLGSGGVCDEHGAACQASGKRREEAWCNRFAASFLMPRAGFAAERKRLGGEQDDPFRIVEELAKRFKVSRYAAAVRAADLADGGSRAAYGGVLNRVAGRYSRKDDLKTGKDGEDEDEEEEEENAKARPAYLDVLVSQIGRMFIRLTVSSYRKGVINGRDLGDYLDMDLGHLGALCKKVSIAE